MSACEEERCDQVDARGTNNVVGGCDDGVKVQVDDGVANGVAVRQEESLVRSPEASLGGVCWRGNSLWSGHEGVSNALVPTVREEQLVDVVVNYIGPVVEGSTTEVLVTNEYKRKVRLLIDVISSLQSPEEKRKADKALQRQGHGRPCKSAAILEIIDISLTDSDLLHRKEAILKEVEETVEFSKLLVVGSFAVPVCCGGVFNAVLSLEEHHHCVGDKRGMANFISFVEEAGLLDIPASDQARVRLSSGVVDCGPRLFRFLNCWLEKRGHVKLMELEWCRISTESSSPLSMLEKLRRLKAS
ncbi:hypothetical protein V6N13_100412 [Hibiscus sabdariffa]